MIRRRCASGRRRIDETGDAGMSLVELLVAMFVASILLAGVATVFSGTLSSVRTVNVKTATAAEARIAMESISRNLRVAVKASGQTSALATATDSSLAFYALLNRTNVPGAIPLPTLVEYSWSANCLAEAKTPGRMNSLGVLVWDTGRTSTCVAHTSVAPTFTYYLDSVTTTALAVPATGLSAVVRPTVTSVRAAVTVKDPNNPGVTGVPVQSRITLINVLNGG